LGIALLSGSRICVSSPIRRFTYASFGVAARATRLDNVLLTHDECGPQRKDSRVFRGLVNCAGAYGAATCVFSAAV
jgi:hypothetical protein